MSKKRTHYFCHGNTVFITGGRGEKKVFLHPWLFLVVLLCFPWQRATSSHQAVTISDYDSIFLLQFQNGSANDGASWHQKSLVHSQSTEVLQRAKSFIEPAISSATSGGISPSSLLLFLYDAIPNEKHAPDAASFCIDVPHSSSVRVWSFSEEKTQPVVCLPLSDKNNQQVCHLKPGLGKEHQVVAMSGARLNPSCTRSILHKLPVERMAVLSYSSNRELYENPEYENGKESNRTLPASGRMGSPVPPVDKQPDLLLNGGGGGGWDDFFDPGKRRPPPGIDKRPKTSGDTPGYSVCVY